jgi:hypothetical protein
VILPENGSARAKFARNSKVVRHVSEVIALFADGPRSPGTTDTLTKARRDGLTVWVHHEGEWQLSDHDLALAAAIGNTAGGHEHWGD